MKDKQHPTSLLYVTNKSKRANNSMYTLRKLKQAARRANSIRVRLPSNSTAMRSLEFEANSPLLLPETQIMLTRRRKRQTRKKSLTDYTDIAAQIYTVWHLVKAVLCAKSTVYHWH